MRFSAGKREQKDFRSSNVEEADHFQDTMYTLMDERMKHRSNSEDSKDVNDRFFPTGKVSDLARERRKFHNKIMGN